MSVLSFQVFSIDRTLILFRRSSIFRRCITEPGVATPFRITIMTTTSAMASCGSHEWTTYGLKSIDSKFGFGFKRAKIPCHETVVHSSAVRYFILRQSEPVTVFQLL